MEYQRIQPISVPGLRDEVIAIRKRAVVGVPQLPFLEEVETVTALNTAAPYGRLIVYERSDQFYRLSENPVRLRHNGGGRADLELWVDGFTFVQSELVSEPNGVYPPVDPFGLAWGKESYYDRWTTMYIFQGIVVPERSTKVWDGRWSLCVNSVGEVVSSESRLEEVRGEARAAVSNPGQPTYVQGVGMRGRTKQPEKFGVEYSKTSYDLAIDEWLRQEYNADGIGSPPSRIDKQIQQVNSSPGNGDNAIATTTVAALLDGYYFVDWVEYTFFSA